MPSRSNVPWADPLEIFSTIVKMSEAVPERPGTASDLVEVLLAYLNRGDLLHDLQETVRQIRRTVSGGEAPARSVKTIICEGGRKRKLSHRLTDDEVRELVAAFEAGTTRMELAEQYGIGRSSVAKLLREWRKRKPGQRACGALAVYPL